MLFHNDYTPSLISTLIIPTYFLFDIYFVLLLFGCAGSWVWCSQSLIFIVAARGIQLPDQGWNPGPASGAWGQPVDRQGSRPCWFLWSTTAVL